MPNILLNVPLSVLDAFDRAWRRTPARSRSGLMVRVLSEWAEVQGGTPPWAVTHAEDEPVEVTAEDIEACTGLPDAVFGSAKITSVTIAGNTIDLVNGPVIEPGDRISIKPVDVRTASAQPAYIDNMKGTMPPEMQNQVNQTLNECTEIIEASFSRRLQHEPFCPAASAVGGPCSCGAERRASRGNI